jgi:hypothetical protein
MDWGSQRPIWMRWIMFRKLRLYPILFSIFPILSLAAFNIREISLDVVLRPLLVSLLFGIILYFILRLLLGDEDRSALAALTIAAPFFFYGQVYNLLEDIVFKNISLFRHRTLLPLFGLLFICLFYFVVWKVNKPERFTRWLNLLSIWLLVYPTYGIVSFTVQQKLADRVRLEAAQEVVVEAGKPDVYYIILDGYGREDVFRDLLGFDNHEFITALRTRGFYVADCSQSNYAYTNFSLPSSLSYDYLDVLNTTQDGNDRFALLKYGVVRSFFKARGYEVVAFPTGWAFTEWTDADLYITYQRPITVMSEFEDLFLNTTVVRVAYDYKLFSQNADSAMDLRRLRVFSLLDNLKNLPYRDGQQFVFAHMVVPHFPYSFAPNRGMSPYKGEGATEEDVKSAYVEQVKFVNEEILDVIDVLLKESDTPPVILIQGDHGPLDDITVVPKERMSILNAYYLPGVQMDKTLYPSISPVNSFRVVLNAYFDQNLPLLEDKSFYAPTENRNEFQLIPNSCPGAP